MTDSHVHILPDVDDGAIDDDQSLVMIDMAKADGINRWIFTPHLNHRSSKFTYEELKNRFDQWIEKNGERYGAANFLFGVEVYIDDIFFLEFDKMKSLPTFENSHYMLIEFSRSYTLEKMLDAINKLTIKGIQPILAHVEVYDDLLSDASKVKLLSDEGAIIQLSSASLTISKYRSFIKKIMFLNALDIVASDAHNTDTRKPILSEAYAYVSKNYSKAWADRLFIDTPKLIYYGERYFKPIPISPIQKTHFLSIGYSVVLGMILIFAGFSQFNTIPRGASEQYIAEITNEEIPLGSAIVNLNSTEYSNLPTPSLNYLNAIYKIRVDVIQNQYAVGIERIYKTIMDAQYNSVDEEKMNLTLKSYLDEAYALEIQCDISVHNILYNFQQSLEKFKYPLDSVETLLKTYHRVIDDINDLYFFDFK